MDLSWSAAKWTAKWQKLVLVQVVIWDLLETLVAWYEMHFEQFSESMHSDSKTLREALQLFAA